MLDLARRRIDTQHHDRDPSLSDSVGDYIPAVVTELSWDKQLDVGWFAPNERHLHGAPVTAAMAHIAI